jgi:sterol desaturase/sphingolipid hydroxylase (fatty acid hydroxylase superfamily)
MFGWAVLSYQFISNGIIAGLVVLFGPVLPSTLPTYVTRSVVTVMLFLAYELGYWFNHWLSHKVPLLWEFHKVHHNAEVLTPLTNFRVHPVYTWIFTNILAFSAAVANGFGNYVFGETAIPICTFRHQHHSGVVHSRLCASPAFAHVDFLPWHAGPHFR